MSPSTRVFLPGVIAALCAVGVQGDGTGLIGWGKTLYNPTCAFACRNVVRKQKLLCTPAESGVNHGTAHNPVTTPPGCFVQDPAFLKTMALCIDTYCPLSGDPSMDLIEDYWASHLGTGTLGNYDYKPAMFYRDALAEARREEVLAANVTDSSASSQDVIHEHVERSADLLPRQHGHGSTPEEEDMDLFDVSSPLPPAAGGSAPLNVTSFVEPRAWQLQYNYMYDFETNEAGHSTMTIIITIVAIFLPLALSLFRFIPALTRSRGWAYLQSLLIYPATWGKHHREPVAGGTVPNRGQTLYILLLSFLNLVLWLGPYVIHQPQASFASRGMQTLSIVGNRAGVMAMGNVVALFLFAARNNVLLHLTDWSYGTYLLLHRWLGYWAVFHTVVHSCMLWANYAVQGGYEAELARDYWRWGIVGTVAACAMLPFSLLVVRQKFYEVFLASHVVFSLLFIVGYYYHIWYVYEYNWGYEIWIFVAGGIWGLDRVVRLARMARNGIRTAVVSAIQDVDGEYVRIEIEGTTLKGGVAYLAFPTLGWRFWETHPFSVAYSGPSEEQTRRGVVEKDKAVQSLDKVDPEKAIVPTEEPVSSSMSSGPVPSNADNSTVFYARTRTGLTKKLASRVYGTEGASNPVRLRVIIEGPYHHSGQVSSQLAQCTGVLCIAGGVGITACMPYLRQGGSGSTKLFWSSRKPGLAAALAPALATLPSSVLVQTVVGERLNLDGILSKELLDTKETGTLAVLVCGPPAMADDVRQKVVSITRANSLCRPYLLLDEAFGW